jgi:hypothetical protein
VNREYREEFSEVDVTISHKNGVIYIEAKYIASVSLRTTNDMRRYQVIRYLDLAAYHYLNHPDGVKEFYFVLIMDTEKPPWVLTRYKSQRNLDKGLTYPGLFPIHEDISSLLSKGIAAERDIHKIISSYIFRNLTDGCFLGRNTFTIGKSYSLAFRGGPFDKPFDRLRTSSE